MMPEGKITEVARENQEKTRVKENLVRTEKQSQKKLKKKLLNKLLRVNNRPKKVPSVRVEEEEAARVNNDGYYFKFLK